MQSTHSKFESQLKNFKIKVSISLFFAKFRNLIICCLSIILKAICNLKWLIFEKVDQFKVAENFSVFPISYKHILALKDYRDL